LRFPWRGENNATVHWSWRFKTRAGGESEQVKKRNSACAAGPDFLCIGAHKSGTTWLYHQLEAHPEFWMPPFKELHYLDQLGRVDRASAPRRKDQRDLRFLENLHNLAARSHIDLEGYACLFEPKGSLLSGDISPGYSTLHGKVIRQVVRYFPNLKVLFLARDPVERVWSHLSMAVRSRQIDPFDVTDIDAVKRNLLRRGLLLRSYPSVVVARWKRYVRPERFGIFFFDDLERNPAELRRTILIFLGADPDKFAISTQPGSRGEPGERLEPDYNSWAGAKKLPLPEHVRSHLAHFFKKELKTCAARLGGPARDWPARYGF
jgi:hypothetical protein